MYLDLINKEMTAVNQKFLEYPFNQSPPFFKALDVFTESNNPEEYVCSVSNCFGEGYQYVLIPFFLQCRFSVVLFNKLPGSRTLFYQMITASYQGAFRVVSPIPPLRAIINFLQLGREGHVGLSTMNLDFVKFEPVERPVSSAMLDYPPIGAALGLSEREPIDSVMVLLNQLPRLLPRPAPRPVLVAPTVASVFPSLAADRPPTVKQRRSERKLGIVRHQLSGIKEESEDT